MEALDAAQKIDLLRTALAVVAGLWVLFLYRKRRQGKAVVRIALSCRAGSGPSRDRVLFVRVHLANVSSVVVRNVKATLMLLIPSQLDQQPLRFTGIEADNPLLPVTGGVKGPSGALEFVPDSPHHLEPGECIQSEVMIPLRDAASGVVALRFLVLGTEGRIWTRLYEWGAFAFVNPSTIGHDYTSLSSHATHAAEVH